MILFLTNSRSISTDVPCAAEPPFDAWVESDCCDCTSQSRVMGPGPVGVGRAATNGRPETDEMVPVWETWPSEPGLKDVRRF